MVQELFFTVCIRAYSVEQHLKRSSARKSGEAVAVDMIPTMPLSERDGNVLFYSLTCLPAGVNERGGDAYARRHQGSSLLSWASRRREGGSHANTSPE